MVKHMQKEHQRCVNKLTGEVSAHPRKWLELGNFAVSTIQLF